MRAKVSTMSVAAVFLAVGIAARRAEAAELMQPGAYEVTVNLDLPHLEGMGAAKTATICLQSSNANPTHGLLVLSENNPLGHCPASNIRTQGNELKFDVHCDGKNAAAGYATYTLGPSAFYGRIDMKMGGKNMTMSETQKGRRVGECAAEKPRS